MTKASVAALQRAAKASCAEHALVDIDALELEVGSALVLAGLVDAVFVRENLPKLGAFRGGKKKEQERLSANQRPVLCRGRVGKYSPTWLPHWPVWRWTTRGIGGVSEMRCSDDGKGAHRYKRTDFSHGDS